MENRYRILSIDKRVRYATGMPVVLQSSALTIDTQTNCVLVQLKFLSISPKSLASMKVSILPRDGAKRQLGEPVFHTYLDLEVKRDQEFGAKEAIFLPDNTARYFDILVVEAVFKDGSILPVNAEPDLVIPEQQRLETKLSENYLAAYKKLLSKSGIEYIEEDFHDLWICGCGEINHEKETLCFKCGVKRTALVSAFDKDQLEPVVRNIETEKRKIAEQKKEEKILTEKRSRILIKKMVIGGAAIFILILGLTIVAKESQRIEINNKIEALISNEEYSEASELIEKKEGEEKEEYYVRIAENMISNEDCISAEEYINKITSQERIKELRDKEQNSFLSGDYGDKKNVQFLRDKLIAEKLVSEKDADAVYKEYLLDSFCNGVLSGDIDVDKIGTALDEIGRDYGLRDENTQNMLMAAEDGLIEKKDWMRAAYLWKYLRLLIGDKEELLTQVKAILANMGTDNMDVRKDMLRLACEGQSVDDRKELYDEWLSIAEDSLNQYNYKEALDILEKMKNYEPSNMLLEEAKIEAWALSKCTPFIEWCQIYCGIASNAPSLGSLKNPQSYVSEDNLFLVERRMGGNIYEAWGENGRFDLYQPSGPNIDGWEKIKTALDYGIVYENVDYDRLEGALKDYDAVILPE